MKAIKDLPESAQNILYTLSNDQGFAYTDCQGNITYANSSLSHRLIKADAFQVDANHDTDIASQSIHLLDLLHTSEKDAFIQTFLNVRQGTRQRFIGYLRHGVPCEMFMIPDRGQNQEICGVVVTLHETTLCFSNQTLNSQNEQHVEQPQKNNKFNLTDTAELTRLNRIVFENVADAIMVISEDNIVEMVNPAFSQITGLSTEDICNKTPDLFLNTDFSPCQVIHYLNNVDPEKNKQWQGDLKIKINDGKIIDIHLSVSKVKHPSKDTMEYVLLFNDISKKKSYEQKIWHQANIDALTQLPNRHYFHSLLEKTLKKDPMQRKKLFIIIIDLDRFKWINDTLGYQCGDQLLKEATQRLKTHILPPDVLSHFGGDEFAIFTLSVNSEDEAKTLAESMLKSLEKPFFIKGYESHITARAGITSYPSDASSVDELLQNADAALNNAKNSGNHHVQIFTKQLKEQAQADARLERDLHKAIGDEQLKVFYQPIICTESGNILGAEALLRWQHPELGTISPLKFIPIAEDTELIKPIGCQVVQTALKTVTQWNQEYNSKLKVSVNVSGMQFLDPAFLAILKQLNHSCNKEQILILEITESFFLDVNDSIVHLLNDLKSYGLRFSLDDFGTGFSSLNQLRHFPVDFVKIDRSFVKNTPENLDDRHLCKAIIDMTHNLGLEVIGEGVESQKHIDILRNMKCDMLQGFFYSRPVCPNDFGRLIEADKEKQMAKYRH